MTPAVVLFWAAVFLVLYPYALYPLILSLLSRIRARPVRRDEWFPEVTVIVPVHNQPDAIGAKIANIFDLDYPRDKVHVVVASDGSTDSTDDVVRSFAGAGVRLVRSEQRRGKEAAQNLALEESRGSIVVFTDATILLDRAALRAIVRPFSDPAVGCVSSEDDVTGGGEALYVRYEMALRRLEAAIQTLVGVSGSLYAVRAELAGWTDPRYTRDFLVPLLVIEKGKRVVAEPGARGRFLPAHTPASEFRRKVRTVLRGMDVLVYRRGLLNPLRFPFVAWALLSHKIVRWSAPWALLAALVANAALLPSAPYAALLALQLALYAAALGALVSRRWASSLPGKAALFFLVTNAAVAVASVRFLLGERAVVWEPTKR